MIKVAFNSHVFLRTPALSYIDYENVKLEEFVKSGFFKAAIFFASESLYAELHRNGFDYAALDNKVKISLQKYFNRMCFRPTPFGLFSAFSSVQWQTRENENGCLLNEEKKFYINPDFQFSAAIGRVMEQSNEFKQIKYYTNKAIYSIKNEKRYLACHFNEEQKKNDFFINSFHSDRLLNRLFHFCRNGKTKPEIVAWLGGIVGEEEELEGYTDELAAEGLLISQLTPNMAGAKYFERLIAVSKTRPKLKFSNAIAAYQLLLDKLQNATDFPDVGLIARNELYEQYRQIYKSMFYVGLERTATASLKKVYQAHIRDGLHCLSIISGDASIDALTNFKNRFRKRFEDQEIPLLQAIDREAGVGYEGSEDNFVASELLDGVQLDRQSKNLNFNWTPVHEFFLSRFLRTKDEESIEILDNDLERLKTKSEIKTPPSFSVVFRPLGDKIWLEQAGGCTAAALLGRFTLFSKKMLDEARFIAETEKKSNPGIIFAEVSCFNDEHAANINSNAGVWSYEIPIGVHSLLQPENIIGLSDIMVSVVDNLVVLRSKKLNKIVIPRLSSAYNYSRSELSVFRFLCDIQYQGLKCNFNFDLKELLPGLSYYPRVVYKSCIIFPATWILSQDDISGITGQDEFRRFFENIRLRKCFALTEGDNQLFFDSDNPSSVSLFLKVIKNKKSAVLQEVFFDESKTVIDHQGKPYVAQFIASVFSEDQVYRSLTPETDGITNQKKNRIKRIYLPCDEWIYLKIYCHPAIANNILVNNVKTIISHLRKNGALKNWFFVRYADPENHLRIRIRIYPEGAADALKYLEKKLRVDVEKGSVNSLLLDTYKREIERYGEDMIELAELSFHTSSELVINYIRNSKARGKEFTEIQLALISVNEIFEIFFPKLSDRINLLKRIHETMKSEFEDSKQVKLQMDTKYREYSAFINNMQMHKPNIADVGGKKEFNAFIKELYVLKSRCKWLMMEKQMKFAADMVHMHLNRVFSNSQRKHEFIIYYMLGKYYVSLAAREQKNILSFTVASKGLHIDNLKKAILK